MFCDVLSQSVAKLKTGRLVREVADTCVQFHGGMGYAKEMHAERLWRDARLFRFAPISEEMILNFIATANLGLPKAY